MARHWISYKYVGIRAKKLTDGRLHWLFWKWIWIWYIEIKCCDFQTTFNSLAPGRSGFNFRKAILKLNLVNGGWGVYKEIALRWMPQVLTDGKSTLVQVMAWCCQATSHYLSQCWPRSMSPNGVTRPQWVKVLNFRPTSVIAAEMTEHMLISSGQSCSMTVGGRQSWTRMLPVCTSSTCSVFAAAFTFNENNMLSQNIVSSSFKS